MIWALRTSRAVVGSVTALTGCLISAPGLAQTAGAGPGDQGTPAATAVAERQAAPGAVSLADRVELQEVVVTASRREEAALQVPASLTVLGGDTLDQLGAKSIQDYAPLVPGLQVAEVEPGYSLQVLRGITTGINATGATVATYIDDTPTTGASVSSLGSTSTPDPDLFDVQRIEVLKGPQGTLYGASSMGGLIKYVTNPPNLREFQGKAEVGYEGVPGGGSGNSARALVNIPLLSDVLAVRADVFRVAFPGYIDNVFRNETDVNAALSLGGRVSVLWRPVDAFSLRLTSYYQRLTSDNPGAMDVQPLTLQPTSGDLKTAEKLPEPLYSKWSVNNAVLSYDFPWANLSSSTSVESQYTRNFLDASNYYGTLYQRLVGGNAALVRSFVDTKKTTEEVRLVSPGGGMFEWIAGFYYTHERATAPTFIDQYDAVGATDTSVFPNVVTVTLGSLLRETAAYGDLTYRFSPSFDVQGGIRYAHIAQDYDQTNFTLAGVPLVPDLAGNATLSKNTYLGVARYHFNQDTMLYARVATGYRPGGPNDVIPGVSAAPAAYQSDSLISYEFGIKGALASERLDYTIGAFRIDWKNIQVQGVDTATGFGFYDNGGKAHSQGLELELGYHPVRGLRVGVSGSYDDARLDEDIPVNGVTAKSGNELPYAAKVSYAGTVDYEHPMTSTVRGFAGLTVAGVGSRRAFFADQTVGLAPLGLVSKTGDLPAYATLDLRGGITRNRVTVTAYLRNVTDKRGAVALYGKVAGADLATGTVGPAALTVIQPRTVGVTARFEF
jgi:outer membrane receptor protein involved in Fe transport